jgi:hypothetical protein
MTQVKEHEYEIRIVECKEFVYDGFPNDSFEGTSWIKDWQIIGNL